MQQEGRGTWEWQNCTAAPASSIRVAKVVQRSHPVPYFAEKGTGSEIGFGSMVSFKTAYDVTFVQMPFTSPELTEMVIGLA